MLDVFQGGTVQYPYLLLEGIEYEAEIRYFKNLVCGVEQSIPLMINVEGELIKLCDVDLTHRFLIGLKRISGGTYILKLVTENDIVDIDYSEPETAIQCLKVW